jgi:hypothetical protein
MSYKESLESQLDAIFRRHPRCPTCNGTGIVYERHDFATEALGCQDCQGTGIDTPPPAPEPSHIYVLFNNDWAVTAYTSEAAAKAEAERRQELVRAAAAAGTSPMSYWHVHSVAIAR